MHVDEKLVFGPKVGTKSQKIPKVCWDKYVKTSANVKGGSGSRKRALRNALCTEFGARRARG